MSIKNKLFLSFGLLIGILVIGIVLNQVISNNAAKTYQKLKVEAIPAMKAIEKYDGINRELFLLISSKTFNSTIGFKEKNRLNGILDVELPYLKSEIYYLQGKQSTTEVQVSGIKKIIELSDLLITQAKEINRLLITNEDYGDPSKFNVAKSIFEDDITDYYTALNTEIISLDLYYNELLENYQNEFAESLNWSSNFILISGILGVLVGLLFSYQVILSISKPIERLKEAAHQISDGNYETLVNVEGKDEIAELASSFNLMANSLKANFKEIEESNNKINIKNKELEQFAYIASHDLQEPLRTVTSFIDLLKEEFEAELPENGGIYLNFISEAAVRMRKLISGLLEYSKIGNNRVFQEVDCNDLVNSSLDDLGVAISDSKAVVHVEDLPKVNGSEVELRSLFQNLIANAIKFKKEGVNPEVKISSKFEKGKWVFCIADNGIGISKEYRDKIFIIFQRLHDRSEFEGTGIGLAHCRKIVEGHNGQIWVESGLNEGSSFYFTIPG